MLLAATLKESCAAGKITGKEGLAFEGEARCFDSEEQMLAELSEDHESFRVSRSRSVTALVCQELGLRAQGSISRPCVHMGPAGRRRSMQE